jgi:hypothetical protein
MRYPPAVTYALGASRVYRGVACGITVILIAICAHSAGANGQFGLINTAWLVLASIAIIWLLRDAWRRQQGSLRYRQGQWSWAFGEEDIAGTCALHLDLQDYVLVSFKPHANDSDNGNKPLSKRTQWFHLEGRREDPAAGPCAWLALRRALHAPAAMHVQLQPERTPGDGYANGAGEHEKRVV